MEKEVAEEEEEEEEEEKCKSGLGAPWVPTMRNAARHGAIGWLRVGGGGEEEEEENKEEEQE